MLMVTTSAGKTEWLYRAGPHHIFHMLIRLSKLITITCPLQIPSKAQKATDKNPRESHNF